MKQADHGFDFRLLFFNFDYLLLFISTTTFDREVVYRDREKHVPYEVNTSFWDVKNKIQN